jgi:isopentenyl diphosphate isomerase/L-lactate dehydrogenase-like FMN-dependent dehydrogenase
MHPRWRFSVIARYLLGEGMPTYAHYPEAFRAAITRPSIADAVRLEHRLSWDDLRRLRDYWPAKLVIKGLLSVEDAEAAAAAGADAIVVSAHRGRNLDCLPAPATCFPLLRRPCADAWRCLPTVASGAAPTS